MEILKTESQLAINCGPNHENDDVFLQILRDVNTLGGGKGATVLGIAIGTKIEFGYGDQAGVGLTKLQVLALLDFLHPFLDQQSAP